MGVESSPQYPAALNTAWPLETDTRREGAQHLRNIKTALVNTTVNLSGVPFDGNWATAGANGGLLHQSMRIGGYQIVFPGDAYNPANYVGGTWVKAGSIAVNQTSPVARDPSAPDLAPNNVLWLWIRTA